MFLTVFILSALIATESAASNPGGQFYNEQTADKFCAKSTVKPNPSSPDYHKLGRRCLMNDGEEGRRMWDGTGIDCLLCCPGHHWDRRKKQCQPCPPGQVAPEPNPFHYCRLNPGNEHDAVSVVKAINSVRLGKSENETDRNEVPATASPVSAEKFTTLVKSETLEEARLSTNKLVELVANEIRPHSIFITWSTADDEGVEKFDVTWRKDKAARRESIQTSPAVHSYNISGMDPYTKYVVTVAAVYKDAENVLSNEFIVMTSLPPVSGLRFNKSGSNVDISWTVERGGADFNVMLQYKHESDDGIEEKRLEAATGRASFKMKETGKYVVDVFYADRLEIAGPSSSFVVDYVAYQECGVWCVFCYIMVGFAVCVLMIFVFLMVRRKVNGNKSEPLSGDYGVVSDVPLISSA